MMDFGLDILVSFSRLKKSVYLRVMIILCDDARRPLGICIFFLSNNWYFCASSFAGVGVW